MNRFSVVLLASFLGGCALPRSPGMGILYTDNKTGVAATSNASGSRVGEACTTSYLGLISSGDASIETARRNGGIAVITSVDESDTKVLGVVYSKYCTIVRGK